MAHLIVPPLDEEPWPSLGEQVCDFLEERAVFGPGDLAGQPAFLSPEKRAILYRAYEVYPAGHRLATRRRFKRVGWSVRKGMAKTELQAWVAFLELHPEAPVRCDGFDASGDPVGRPVASPYIPMLAYNKDQVEELAFGALTYVCGEGPDADLFDISLERVIRLSPRGTDDGKALPVAQSPSARDGARTTHQAFDEPHRMFLPRLIHAHQTMANNLPKRPAADAWSFYVGTAGELGQGSIAESLHLEAEAMHKGKAKSDPRLFYFHRDAGQVHRGDEKGAHGHNLGTKRGRLAAIKEATGPDGEYGLGQFDDIAELYTRPGTDRAYWERVQLNLWIKAGGQAFDPTLWRNRRRIDEEIPKGASVVGGFDGARFRDATGIVLTDLNTGLQQPWGAWERPEDVEEWEVPETEVTASWEEAAQRFNLVKVYGDPPHWTETYGAWAARWPDVFEEWWTARIKEMAYAIRAYREGQATGACTHTHRIQPGGDLHTFDEAFDRHIAAAGRKDVNIWDDDGTRLFVLSKLHPDRKFDLAMAGCLSWKAYLDGTVKGWARKREFVMPVRLR